jgi:hypothetical protein
LKVRLTGRTCRWIGRQTARLFIIHGSVKRRTRTLGRPLPAPGPRLVPVAFLLAIVDVVLEVVLALGPVSTVSAAEARRLAALVLNVSLQGVGPHVGLAASIADVLVFGLEVAEDRQ